MCQNLTQLFQIYIIFYTISSSTLEFFYSSNFASTSLSAIKSYFWVHV